MALWEGLGPMKGKKKKEQHKKKKKRYKTCGGYCEKGLFDLILKHNLII